MLVIKTKPMDSKPQKPYCSVYGPRSGLRSASNVNTLVNFSFLRPRKGIDLDKLQEITPAWKKDMEHMIKNYKGKNE